MTPLGTDWTDAAFVLPRGEQMPVEVKLSNGRIERRKEVEGDWRAVVAWRLAPGKGKSE